MPISRMTGRTYPISAYLVIIVLIAVLPVIVFSSFVAKQLVETRRIASQQYLEKTASELALAFDQEVVSTIRTLEAQTQSNSLRRGDLRVFHEVLTRVLKTQPTWTNIVLHKNGSQGVLEARSPYGTPFGKVLDPESIDSVLRSKKPSVGNIVEVGSKENRATTTSPFRFAVRVPVIDENGEAVYVISAILSSDLLSSLVNRFAFAPNEWTRTIVDSSGTIGARSRNPEKFLGQKASVTLREAFGDRNSGTAQTTTLEGIKANSAFYRAPISGWYAAIAVPTSVLQAEAAATGRNILLIAIASLLFSTLGTFFFSRGIQKSINAASENAARLAKGEAPEMKVSSISEIEEMRNSLIVASGLLRSRERTKDEFLANMSHELRTPLGIVLGMTDQIAKDAIPPDEKEKSWEIVKRNGLQLSRLIDDILDFSKIEANKLVIENVEFSLPDLISSVVEDFSTRALERKIQIKTHFDEGSPVIISSDPVRVRQIVGNVVGNAVKFTVHGMIEVRLHKPEGLMQRLTVSDTGIGLNDQQQSVLFTEFTQGDSSHTRKFGGTGLGLSLSRKIARRIGGDVKLIQSRENEGSMFEISFLSQPLADRTQQSGDPSVHSPSPRAISSRTKILLVEDSPDNVTLIKTYLRKSNVDLHVAMNGQEAVDKEKNGEFDLILMDIQMPIMDGFEATKLIRGRGCKIPIVALTAHALGSYRKAALEGGFTDFITKPVEKESLLQVIGSHLSSAAP
jgi:signal transduction histidine kinase